MSAVPEQKAKPNPRLPLVAPFESRYGDLSHKDPKLINAFAERLEDGTYRVLKRQGVATYQTLATLPVGWAITGACGNFYAEYLGAVFSATTPVVLTFVNVFNSGLGQTSVAVYFNGISPSILVDRAGHTTVGIGPSSGVTCVQYTSKLVAANVSVGGIIFIYVIDVSTSTVTSLAYPSASTTSAQGIATLDSTTYVMDQTATIYGSAVGDAGTYPALNYIQAISEPGAGVYLAKHYAYIVAMKEFSLEFFYDAANPTGSPLSGVQNSTILWGCASASSVQSIGNVIFWLARERQGAYFVAKLDAMRHSKVSSPGIDKLVGDPVGPITSFAYRDTMGHQYYGLTDMGAGYTV